MRSKDVLKTALSQYDGTLILVSHDRDFLQGLTNRVFEFRNGNVKQHTGDINEYLRDRKVGSFRQIEQEKITSQKAKATKEEEPKEDNWEKKQNEKVNRDLQIKVSKSEKHIEKLETEIKALDAKLADPDQYQEATNDKEFFPNYEKLKKQLEEEMKKWEELQQKMA
jgi:ATP-binding cassette subfamily F protein 3